MGRIMTIIHRHCRPIPRRWFKSLLVFGAFGCVFISLHLILSAPHDVAKYIDPEYLPDLALPPENQSVVVNAQTDTGLNRSTVDLVPESDLNHRLDLAAQNDSILADVLRSADLTSAQRQFLYRPVINPHNYSFSVNPFRTCQDSSLNMLVVLPSAPGNLKRRAEMRWSVLRDYVTKPESRSRMLFFIGNSRDPAENAAVVEESKEFGDIVIIDFLDEYKNVRLKMVSMLQWASVYCSHVPYVLRNDDDVYPKYVFTSAKLLQSITQHNFILGHFCPENTWTPQRGKSSKYYLPHEQFPGKYFPPFSRGGFVGFSGLTVKLLYEAALRVPIVWLDDVYITGICANHIHAAKISNPYFNFKH